MPNERLIMNFTFTLDNSMEFKRVMLLAIGSLSIGLPGGLVDGSVRSFTSVIGKRHIWFCKTDKNDGISLQM